MKDVNFTYQNHLLFFKSSPYFYSKKYLKHFITKLIAIDLKLQVKLKVSIMIPPTMRPSAAWGSRGWTTRGGLESYWPRQEAKAWPGLPALASPTLGPFTRAPSRRPSRTRSPKMVHRREPQAAEGHRVGRIIIETLSFACYFKSIAMSFMMKCLRHFWLDILKKTVSP